MDKQLGIEDVDLIELADRIEALEKADAAVDLQVSLVLGIFGRYASNLQQDPTLIRLSLKEHDWSTRADQVEIKVVSQSGNGGIIYSDELPAFTASLDTVLGAAAKLGFKSWSWTMNAGPGGCEAYAWDGVGFGCRAQADQPARALLTALVRLLYVRRSMAAAA